MQWINIERALFTLFVTAVLAGAIQVAREWSIRASIIILVLGTIGLLLCVIQLINDWRNLSSEQKFAALTMEEPASETDGRWGALEIWCWIVGFYVAIHLVGFLAAVPVFVFLYTKLYGGGWGLSILMAACSWGFVYSVFDTLLHVPWPQPLLFSLIS